MNGAPQPADSFKPYDLITPKIKGEEKVVRLLFSYDCPYCRSYHNGLVQWGKSLPTPYRFDATPVITSNSDNILLAVYGRLIMQGLAPSKIHLYDYTMYTLIQGDPDTGQPALPKLANEDIIRTVLQSSGASGKDLQAFMNAQAKGIEKRLPAHASVIQRYGLKATPSVAIGGKIVVTPDHASSNAQQYLLLLNAMVSRAIQGGIDAL
ncbi:hypothetical protein OX89_04240 [Diaphorobacter sp. J5-51]|nr:hypothetical protein OX89_04240 [Diaphorobacter sp. J5-51]